MCTFIKNYVQGCGICQQFKINRSPANPTYQAIEGAKTTRLFAHCSMDQITDLPLINGHDSILVVVDRGLSKGVILCPCNKTFTGKGAALLLWDNLFKRFGLPDKIISDRDLRYAAHAFQELLKLLNIWSNLTTAYHPQSDGATERVNQEIKAYLAIYCASHSEEWLNSLSTLKFTHNNRRHAEQIHTLFELIQGDSPISTTFSHPKFPSHCGDWLMCSRRKCRIHWEQIHNFFLCYEAYVVSIVYYTGPPSKVSPAPPLGNTGCELIHKPFK